MLIRRGWASSGALAVWLAAFAAANAADHNGSNAFATGWARTNQVRFEVKTNYYAVTGSTHQEVQQSIRVARPRATPYDAWTEWHVRCTFRPRPAGSQYVLDAYELRGQATITLPHWNPARSVETGLHEAWWTYLKALAAHEQGHLDVARDTMKEIERRLRDLPGFASPHDFNLAANQVVQQVTADYRAKEREYDRRTRHGALQGAVFHRGRSGPEPPAGAAGAGGQ